MDRMRPTGIKVTQIYRIVADLGNFFENFVRLFVNFHLIPPSCLSKIIQKQDIQNRLFWVIFINRQSDCLVPDNLYINQLLRFTFLESCFSL